jgi:hypothetical protein
LITATSAGFGTVSTGLVINQDDGTMSALLAPGGPLVLGCRRPATYLWRQRVDLTDDGFLSGIVNLEVHLWIQRRLAATGRLLDFVSRILDPAEPILGQTAITFCCQLKRH